MYQTAEVRWFYRGAIPEEVRGWLRHWAGEAAEEAPRLDSYLHLPENDDLGIKLRLGRLEIKHRLSSLGEVSYSQRSAGLAEVWQKWSFPLAISNQDTPPFWVPVSSWIAVEKERQLYRFNLGSRAEVVQIPLTDQFAQGCEVEMTNLRVAGIQWWSLAFEAFGGGSDPEAILSTTARFLLAHEDAPILALRASYSYPGWLLKIGPDLA